MICHLFAEFGNHGKHHRRGSLDKHGVSNDVRFYMRCLHLLEQCWDTNLAASTRTSVNHCVVRYCVELHITFTQLGVNCKDESRLLGHSRILQHKRG